MEGNGQVLNWSGRVFSAEDLRRSLNGQRELVLTARAVITPLAAEELRAKSIRVTRRDSEEPPVSVAAWGYSQEQPEPLIASAVQALKREGIALQELRCPPMDTQCHWAQAVAKCVAQGACKGGVVFCQDAGLVCCVANKVAGLRAVAVASVSQAARATLSIGANLIAIELPGRTFFEVRQILRSICGTGEPNCPPGVSCTLKELDGHAHR